jgi:very-short-patch-repair endonuclease
MGEIFNHKTQKPKWQYLRNNATNAERRLWKKLKGKQFFGLKFRRQHGIGPYIVDFYCPEIRLVIEVDGVTHSTRAEKEYDRQSEEYIRQFGVEIVRFTNSAVYRNLELVLCRLQIIVTKNSPQSKKGEIKL